MPQIGVGRLSDGGSSTAAPPLVPEIRNPDAPRARTQWLDAASLADVAEPWRDLAERALESNVFYEPGFALPALKVFGAHAGALLVWSARHNNRLIGLFPGSIDRRRYGISPAVHTGWTHPYAPLGVPLVDRHEAADAVAAWLGDETMPAIRLLPYLPSHGKFVAVLRDLLEAQGGKSAAFGAHTRALLAPAAERDDYVSDAVPAKKLKELRRQRRRLSDSGPVNVMTASSPFEVAEALDAFFFLEQQGWKGAAGTAAADHPAVLQFIRDALHALAERRQVRILRLMQGGRTVAAAIALRSGTSAWFWKIAFDEAAAPASPGVQLSLDLTRTLLADPTLAQVDSCATPDHPMIDHLWRERLDLADVMIATRGEAARRFGLVCNLESARRRTIDAARWARTRLRGR